MRPNTKTLLVAGGAILTAGGLIYLFTRKSSDAVSDALLLDVAATREDGPKYDFALVYGPWTIDREKQNDFRGLKAGAIVWLSMYPTDKGYNSTHYNYAVQITGATVLKGFTIYSAKWMSAPNGVDPNETLSITSADIVAVAK